MALATQVDTTPLIITIPHELQLIEWGLLAPQLLAPGDLLQLHEYEQLTDRQGNVLSTQRSFDDLLKAYAPKEARLVPHARARWCLKVLSLARREKRLALVDQAHSSKRGLLKALYILVEGTTSTACIKPSRLTEGLAPSEGARVSAFVAVVPQGMHQAADYVIPQSYPIQSIPWKNNRSLPFTVLRVEEGPFLHRDPMTKHLAPHAQSRRLKEYQDLVILTARFVQMRQRRDCRKAGGTATMDLTEQSWDYSLSVPQSEPECLLQRIKQWRARVLVKLGTDKNTTVPVYWEASQVQLSTRKETEGALKLRISLTELADILKAKRMMPVHFSHEIIPKAQRNPRATVDEEGELETQLATGPKTVWVEPACITTEQENVIFTFSKCFLHPQQSMLFVQAPAGTGKTRMIGAIVGSLRSKPSTLAKGIVLTATTNNAATNLLEAVKKRQRLTRIPRISVRQFGTFPCKGIVLTATTNNAATNLLEAICKEDLGTTKVLLLQSDLEDRRTRSDENRVGDAHRLRSYATSLLDSPLARDQDKDLLRRFVEKKDACQRPTMESRVTSLVIRLCRPDIIVATMAMVQAHHRSIRRMANVLLID
ncbi:hypothetical protein QR680_010754 [Steinernema hermaphroditum]|uniref:DNA2/NAM7 helicase helicase domain-containing protein n=1 Tax=Steinernema hermaphroditum TaxID=289476 RepID=A0AA39IRF3_9BILA|nr:hypothetical protein QR680_010754 [Steinernema hermaphroditum]